MYGSRKHRPLVPSYTYSLPFFLEYHSSVAKPAKWAFCETRRGNRWKSSQNPHFAKLATNRSWWYCSRFINGKGRANWRLCSFIGCLWFDKRSQFRIHRGSTVPNVLLWNETNQRKIWYVRSEEGNQTNSTILGVFGKIMNRYSSFWSMTRFMWSIILTGKHS